MPKRKRHSAQSQGTNNSPAPSLLPQKRHYRQRAHANPFSDHNLVYPAAPDQVDWAVHYPAFAGTRKAPEFADVGCGFGGLLTTLAPLYPDTLMLGLEIRVQVSQYVEDRIAALRASAASAAPATDQPPGAFQNVSIVRANAMKFLPNYFAKHSLAALFFLFPDPHFKLRKHKARIISPTLLAEYAYVLRPGGVVYTITDVQDLAAWMRAHLAAFPLFEHVEPDVLRAEGKGPILDAVWNSTEEGKKVERNKGDKWLACFRRIQDPPEDADEPVAA
ncbi:putative methyltransferase [Gloeopeniophorella convolvens]|nr:putative methyltransferase [Gloeopeniophorella convolvens]